MEVSNSGYKVTQLDAYIDVVWRGRISREMAASCVREVRTAANQMLQANKPILLRVTVENPPKILNTDAFAEVLDLLHADIPFTRIVMWGKLATPVRLLVGVLMDSFQHTYDMRYVEDEHEATSWLLNYNKPS